MKLPKRGFFADNDGHVLWAWEHWNVDTDFDSITPFITTMDGETRALIPPAGTIVDLEAEDISPGDMSELHRDLESTRFRKRADGSVRIVKVMGDPGAPLEIDHPMMDIINARRSARGKSQLRKGE